jgi:hypothetical protein
VRGPGGGRTWRMGCGMKLDFECFGVRMGNGKARESHDELELSPSCMSCSNPQDGRDGNARCKAAGRTGLAPRQQEANIDMFNIEVVILRSCASGA